jgi:predicted RNase H-like nuclease (RuvC/YqgF family)
VIDPVDMTQVLLRQIQESISNLTRQIEDLQQKITALDDKVESFRDDLNVTTGIAIRFTGERLIWKRLEKRIEKLEQQRL